MTGWSEKVRKWATAKEGRYVIIQRSQVTYVGSDRFRVVASTLSQSSPFVWTVPKNGEVRRGQINEVIKRLDHL